MTKIECRRLTLLDHQGGDQFDGHIAGVETLVDFAGLHVEGLACLVSSRRTTFVLEGERPFQNLAHQRPGMGMPYFATTGRDLQEIEHSLKSGRPIFL